MISLEVESLSGCSHEEADTRILLHAQHAAVHYTPDTDIIIRSPDTDVAILSCMLCFVFPNSKVFFKTGTKQHSRLIPMHSITARLGDDMCSSLVGLHAFTGCDSTSAFVGKGKQVAYKLILESPRHAETMRQLSQSFQPTEQLQEACEAYACALYGSQHTSVNKVRYNLFVLDLRSTISFLQPRMLLRSR